MVSLTKAIAKHCVWNPDVVSDDSPHSCRALKNGKACVLVHALLYISAGIIILRRFGCSALI